MLRLRPVSRGVFAGSAFSQRGRPPPASSNRVLNSHYASEISLFKTLEARIQARRGQRSSFFSINRTKNMYIFEMGRKRKTSPAKEEEPEEGGRKDFVHNAKRF